MRQPRYRLLAEERLNQAQVIFHSWFTSTVRRRALMSLRSSIRASFLLMMICVLPLAAAARDATNDPLDWPNWRGPQQNRVSTEKGLVQKWNPEGGEGSNVLWKKKELGGRST